MKDYSIIQTIVFPMDKHGGNPCPIILNGNKLTPAEMQDLAKQLGYETCFITTPERDDCDFRFRYFVPNYEMEMCVHATVGSVTVLVEHEILKKSPMKIETILGPIEVYWEKNKGDLVVEVIQFPPSINYSVPTVAEICQALNLKADDFLYDKIQSVSTSRFKLIVPLKSMDLLQSLRPNYDKLWDLCDQHGITGFYPFAIEEYSQKVIQARQFPNKAGYTEDPATGVAASALGAYCYINDMFPKVPSGWDTYHIKQGVALGRPSYIQARIYSEQGIIKKTSIKGKAMIL